MTQRFGQLLVLQRDTSTYKGKSRWLCLCNCGMTVVVNGASLVSGHTRSCGCLKLEIATRRLATHGMSRHPAYAVWANMRQRCNNSRSQVFRYYGGRGIKVSPDWAQSFVSFWQDMGPSWKPGLTLERNDNRRRLLRGQDPSQRRRRRQGQDCRAEQERRRHRRPDEHSGYGHADPLLHRRAHRQGISRRDRSAD